MDAIQEMIDQNRHTMPTGLAKNLLELCAKREKATHLYKVKYAKFQAYPYYYQDEDDDVQVGAQSHVEYAEKICEVGTLNIMNGNAEIPESWLDRIKSGPFTTTNASGAKVVVFAIEKYLSRKRERSEM
tara:strand:+ start:443 stop:829 length:387 start_codon:yes stop_codon:yes gene_type:complete